ncbi:hypothetical protein GQX73_g7120 [Xylaria multiplex]|uniref:Uncharacterized protein n=1 Tax=Xylaria multiplex TaxID=323545 RepID=A0A7C8MQS8_9PEZI|nr:hypothetical protein GQX73_g7120 [Xylaria multiplex]
MYSSRTSAIQELVVLLTTLLEDPAQPSAPSAQPPPNYEDILASIQRVSHELIPETPLSTMFHDGQVHDPLGGGAYAFQNDIVAPVLRALLNDEMPCATPVETGNPTRKIFVHAGLQPNNSPHMGTIVVFCLVFAFAQAIRGRMLATAAAGGDAPPPVAVLITFVDTAPVKDQGVKLKGIHYQRSYRDVPDALGRYMADYQEVLRFLSLWSGVPFSVAVQSDLFSNPVMPSLVNYMISQRAILGPQLSPKYGSLAIRAACPIPGCGLVEKHGRLNEYQAGDDNQYGSITFHCPVHGSHTVRLSRSEEVARLEANTPTRNLLRSMSHLLDTSAHHIRVTGSDYTGMYQETLLYRPLAAWSGITGLASGRTPHILYAPLITDWSGAKLSKSLYVRDGAYGFMKLLGTGAFCSYAQLRDRFGADNGEGVRKVWEEVQRWVEDPKKLFRTFSLAYLQRVILHNNLAQ